MQGDWGGRQEEKDGTWGGLEVGEPAGGKSIHRDSPSSLRISSDSP